MRPFVQKGRKCLSLQVNALWVGGWAERRQADSSHFLLETVDWMTRVSCAPNASTQQTMTDTT